MAPSCHHDKQTPHGTNQYQARIKCCLCGKVLFTLSAKADTSLLAKVISDFNPGLRLQHLPNGKESENKSPEGDHSDSEWESIPDPKEKKEKEQSRHKMLRRLARLEAAVAQLKCELSAGE